MTTINVATYDLLVLVREFDERAGFLHCHHVEHWSTAGATSLDNLMLLCARHHTLVHEGGFNR